MRFKEGATVVAKKSLERHNQAHDILFVEGEEYIVLSESLAAVCIGFNKGSYFPFSPMEAAELFSCNSKTAAFDYAMSIV